MANLGGNQQTASLLSEGMVININKTSHKLDLMQTAPARLTRT